MNRVRWVALLLLATACGGKGSSPPRGANATGDASATSSERVAESKGVDSEGGELVILAPPPGSHFKPGDKLTVHAAGAGGFVPDFVMFSMGDQERFVDEPPFEATFEIPKEALGTLFVTAVAAKRAGGNAVLSSRRTFEVDVTSKLRELIVEPSAIATEAGLRDGTLLVSGRFEDGVVRELGPESVVFRSSDTAVVTVDAEGDYLAKTKGEAVILVTRDAREARIHVRVLEDPLILAAHEPEPEQVQIEIHALQPRQGFELFSGDTPGVAEHASCSRLPIHIEAPEVVASGSANENGLASLTVPFPSTSATLLLQAVSDDCSTSRRIVLKR